MLISAADIESFKRRRMVTLRPVNIDDLSDPDMRKLLVKCDSSHWVLGHRAPSEAEGTDGYV